MQLVAYGAQDIYLTGNPQITFFKVVYRRYTNFSTELINQTLKGDVKAGRNCKCEISRDGDLIHRIYLLGQHIFFNTHKLFVLLMYIFNTYNLFLFC